MPRVDQLLVSVQRDDGVPLRAQIERELREAVRGGRLRIGIVVIALTPALVGIWATVAPRGFYDGFPGGGHHWVSAVGAYDEHLVRDVGALYLGALVMLAFAFAWLDRRLVQAALVSTAVAALPHLIYHSTALDGFSTGDAVAVRASTGSSGPPRGS